MRRRRLARQGTRGGHPYFRFLLLTLSVSTLLFYSCISPVSGGPVALAHAFGIGSDPVDGSTISTVPRVARIFLGAPISPASTSYVFTPDQPQVGTFHRTVYITASR